MRAEMRKGIGRRRKQAALSTSLNIYLFNLLQIMSSHFNPNEFMLSGLCGAIQATPGVEEAL